MHGKALALATLAASLATGCGHLNGPSDTTVLELTKKAPPPPPQVAGAAVMSSVELVEVAQRGAYQGGYWPVRLRVKGEVVYVDMGSIALGMLTDDKNPKGIPVDFLVDARVRKNDFGEWQLDYDAATARPTASAR